MTVRNINIANILLAKSKCSKQTYHLFRQKGKSEPLIFIANTFFLTSPTMFSRHFSANSASFPGVKLMLLNCTLSAKYSSAIGASWATAFRETPSFLKALVMVAPRFVSFKSLLYRRMTSRTLFAEKQLKKTKVNTSMAEIHPNQFILNSMRPCVSLVVLRF